MGCLAHAPSVQARRPVHPSPARATSGTLWAGALTATPPAPPAILAPPGGTNPSAKTLFVPCTHLGSRASGGGPAITEMLRGRGWRMPLAAEAELPVPRCASSAADAAGRLAKLGPPFPSSTCSTGCEPW